MASENRNKYKDNPDEFKGIHLSYRDNDWILRMNEREYRLYQVIEKDEDSKYAGKYVLGKPKHIHNLKNIFAVMRQQGVSHIMQKKKRQTMKELLKEIRSFHDWVEKELKEIRKEIV